MSRWTYAQLVPAQQKDKEEHLSDELWRRMLETTRVSSQTRVFEKVMVSQSEPWTSVFFFLEETAQVADRKQITEHTHLQQPNYQHTRGRRVTARRWATPRPDCVRRSEQDVTVASCGERSTLLPQSRTDHYQRLNVFKCDYISHESLLQSCCLMGVFGKTRRSLDTLTQICFCHFVVDVISLL